MKRVRVGRHGCVFRSLAGALSLLASSAHAGILPRDPQLYEVQAHETLSEILHRLNLKPLYGKNGTVQRTLALNPHKIPNPDALRPGETIRLPVPAPASPSPPVPHRKPAAEKAASPKAELPHPTPSAPSLTPEDSGVTSSLQVLASYHSAKLSARDLSSGARAHFFSSLSYGTEIRLDHEWDEGAGIATYLGFNRIEFDPPSSTAISAEGLKRTLVRFGAAYRQNITHRLSWQVSAGLDQRLFLTSPSPSRIQIEQRAIPGVSLGARFFLVQRSRFEVALNGLGAWLSPVSGDGYSVLGGYQFGGGLSIRRSWGNRGFLETRLTGSSSVQNTSQTETSLTDYGFWLGWTWNLPD